MVADTQACPGAHHSPSHDSMLQADRDIGSIGDMGWLMTQPDPESEGEKRAGACDGLAQGEGVQGRGKEVSATGEEKEQEERVEE